MTKRKRAGKNKDDKQVNQTANQRAMKNPKTQMVLSALRKGWKKMSPEQRSEELNELIGFKCSVRGIADELGRPATTIRRYVGLAKSAEANTGWIERMKRTLAQKPLTQKTTGNSEVAGRKLSRTPAEKGPRPVIKEVYPVKKDMRISSTQQTTSSSPTSPRPTINQSLSDKESRPEQRESKTPPVDICASKGKAIQDEMERLAAIADSIRPRPVWNARSMPRQGRPLPPIDPK